MRILGLDYGSKTVGVAVSDPLGLTAQKVETIWRKQENKLRRTLARIEELIAEYEVEKIVLGYPKNMNNTVGERAEKALEFGEMLKKRTGLEVIMWDEASDNSRGRPDTYRGRCAQRKSQTVSGWHCGSIYFAGISGFPVSMTKVTTWKKSDFSLLMEQ